MLLERLERQKEKENNSVVANNLLKPSTHSLYNSSNPTSTSLSSSILNDLKPDNQTQKKETKPLLPKQPNTQENEEYAEEYFQELYNFYLKNSSSYGYFLRSHQIEPSLRARMVDWLVQVFTTYKFSNYSYFKAIDLMDKYLATQKSPQTSNKMHIIGITCIYTISKLQQVDLLRLSTLVQKIAHGKFNQRQILNKQTQIMNTLNFNLMTSTSYDVAVLVLHKLSSKFKNIYKNIDSIQEILAYIGKIMLHFYDIMRKYSKNILGLSILILGLSCSNSITTLIKEKILDISQPHSQDCLKEAIQAVANAIITFDREFPNLQNLKKFSKVDHGKLKSKLYMLGY